MTSREPIILIGTHRSGTTWLGDVFSQHPRLAYWVEPRHVWTRGNSYTPDDVLTAKHATPKIAGRIRETFDTFVKAQDRDRLIEKTPSNCLRLPFIRAVYPNAKIIMVVRDGRSVLRSTDEILSGGVPMSRVIQRAKETPLAEWPAYAAQTAGTVYRKLTGTKLRYWGPRPPGWKSWLAGKHADEILALQWAGTLGRAIEDADTMTADGDQILRFRYEDLLANPRETMSEICAFVELAEPGVVIEHAAKTADASRVNKWRTQLDDETLTRVRSHMEPLLTKLGYEW